MTRDVITVNIILYDINYSAPESYDELLDILEGHNLEDQLTIIARIRKCHHPSLAEGNKDKLEV